MKRALELHSTALILMHIHPSGDPTPSGPDIPMTAAAAVLNMAVHDHVIMGNGSWASLRQMGMT